MRKLLRLHTLRNLFFLIPKHNYSAYRSSCNIYHLPNYHCRKYQPNFSTLSSPLERSDNDFSLLQEEFPEPKRLFYQVLNEALVVNDIQYLNPSITIQKVSINSKNEPVWKANITMKWPESFQVEGIASKKANALTLAFLHACQKLKHFGVLDNSNNPALSEGDTVFKDSDVLNSKSDLSNLCKKFWHRTGNINCLPVFNTMELVGFQATKYWKTNVQITYPEEKTFTGIASRSRKAEGIAALKALQWLQSEGIINEKYRVIDYSKDEELRLRKSHLAPYSISIPTELQNEMAATLKKIQEQKELLLNEGFKEKENDFNDENILIRDAITDRVLSQLNAEEAFKRNQILYERVENFKKRLDSDLMDVKNAKSLLPISEKREDILKLIDENQVLVLCGDTGCGKSTQVPQFILDHFIEQKRGAECNIVVTQPRRISAVSLADRVAFERGEKVGETIGYQIRLQKCLPEGNGSILYCTTGMLLRKLRSNPNLEGISHVIIDEVHERNVQIDFLLILLKNILQTNKNIKLLLMSASFNTDLFSQYFGFSKFINVPGKMFPVEEMYLEDLSDSLPDHKNAESGNPFMDPDLVVNVINYVHKTQPPGAILCFLPGWHDIISVKAKLLESQTKNSKLMICPVHSRLPHEEQKKIFLKPPGGKRKVILATNIAETSITIDDVVYVVNSGLHKDTKLDVRAGIASLSTQWITKANVQQRKGRAGRVSPGKCYHLFSRKIYSDMDTYPTAEILRMPLESVILDCKLYCPESKAEEILSQALEPPATDSIEKGIEELQLLGVLDENECLTDLGHVVVQFSTHPRLSVSLVYAAFLRCLDPVLSLSAIFTLEKEPFVNTLDDRHLVKKIKTDCDYGCYSDHMALVRLFNDWQSLNKENSVAEFVNKNFLDAQSLTRIWQLKELFAEDLYKAGIIPQYNSFSDRNSIFNSYSQNDCSIFAALTAAFFPNVIKIVQGDISRGKMSKNHMIYSIIKGQKAHIQKESVASDVDELPSPWLIYFSALKSEARKKALVSAVSSVPGICLLLLTGKNISLNKMSKQVTEEEGMVVLSIDNYDKLRFSCTKEEAFLLLEWRECIQYTFKLFLQSLNSGTNQEHLNNIQSSLIPVSTKLFNTPQIPFIKGQQFRFVNHELVCEAL